MDHLDFGCELKFSDTGDAAAGTLEGYGAVFSVVDNGGDIIAPGSFRKSLDEWKAKSALPAMLWQHDTSQPIGVWTEVSEDERGLRVKGELLMEVPQARVAHALLKHKAMKGLSVGFQTKGSNIDRKSGIRTITEAKLWEISPVTFPMNPLAGVTHVKGDQAPDDRELEEAYREGGLSRREAKIAVSITKRMVLRDEATTEQPRREGVGDLLIATRKLKSLLS